jgi:hypothetical protein
MPVMDGKINDRRDGIFELRNWFLRNQSVGTAEIEI